MDLKGQRVTHYAYFSLLTPTKQLLSVTIWDTTAGFGANFWTDARTDARKEGQTDVEVEIVI